MTAFATASRVRLTPEQRAAQPTIGDAIGQVRGDQDGVVEVEWPAVPLVAQGERSGASAMTGMISRFAGNLDAKGSFIPRQHTARGMPAKLAVRRFLLDAIGADKARVFDGFAGEGSMYRAIWREAAGYVGCDLEWFSDDQREAYVADNRRVLRACDLERFNLFDFDAWGDPWEQVLTLASRRTLKADEPLGLAITDAQVLKMQLQHRPGLALRLLTGVHEKLPGIHHEIDRLHDGALRRVAAMMGGHVERQWRAAGTGRSEMRYVGVVFAHG